MTSVLLSFDRFGLSDSPRHGNSSPLSPSVCLTPVGQGVESCIFRCEDSETGEVFALKEPRSPRARRASTSPDGRAHARRLEGLHHENVLAHKQGCDNGDMIMEYIEGGSVSDLLEREGGHLGEKETATLVEDILKGLQYLHSKNVVHKDLKPSNLLFDSRTRKVKIGDITVASEERTGGVIVPVGTPVFLAPEVVRTGSHVAASDIWSVGCCALQMLSGTLPWHEEDNRFAAMFKIGNGQAPQIPHHVSRAAKSFMEDCFQADPAERPSAEDLLEHPFVQYYQKRGRKVKNMSHIPERSQSEFGELEGEVRTASATSTVSQASAPPEGPNMSTLGSPKLEYSVEDSVGSEYQ
mmetsp:Transcript_29140/g.59714  ORF Transcript_29140/g.59714 Transcript_29140/m.59714 type:complete len:353 (-) Transcript_29140:195-1253(-)